MGRLVHFDVQADDPERAMRFYEKVLGWFRKWDGPMEYRLIETGPKDEAGIDGGLARRPEGSVISDSRASTTFTCTVDVDSVDDAAATVEAQGGVISRPKSAIPGVGWLIYCKDTEGNDFAMMEADSSAA